MGLSAKQKKFIDQYLIDGNATRAAERAGYKGDDNTLAVTGYDNLRNPKIAEAISKRTSESAMSADEVLKRLADQARGSMSDFVAFDENGNPQFDLQTASMMGKLHLTKKLKTKTRSWSEAYFDATTNDIAQRPVTETTIEFELYDAQAALVAIGKSHGIFDKRGSEEDPIHTVSQTLEEWKAEQAKRREQAAGTMDIFDDDLDESSGDE